MSKGEGLKLGIQFTQALIGDISGLTPTPRGYKAGTIDLAQGKSVTVGNASYGAGSNAVDGNNSTYWGTYSTMPWWIVIDMTQIKKTAGFYILQSNASYRARAYNIQGSNDNSIWTTIKTGELQNIVEETIQYPVSNYRYIRLNFTSYWSSSIAFIYTLKILEAVEVGNEIAFSVSGQEYRRVNGLLINGNYVIENVQAHPTIENAILLTMNWWGRFNNVDDKIKVLYDSSKGNLQGVGGAVESFEVEFLPTDLMPTPNPNIEEQITVAPNISLTFTPVEYKKGYDQHTITLAPAIVTATLTHISIINP